jgi:predicted nucleotidyltransferase component of viral defense system
VIEKDYFLTLLLEGISHVPLSSETFVFKGGTAIRKAYIRNYRYSEDLGFTLTKALSSDEIRDSLESALAFIKNEHNADFRIRDYNSKSHFTDVKVQFVGLKGSKNSISLDLSPNEVIVDEPKIQAIFNPYYGKKFSVPTYTLEEIVAEKLRSMLQRIRVRDYYDVWYLLSKKRNELDMKKIRKIFLKKIEYKKIAFAGKDQFMDKHRLEQTEAYYATQLAHQISDLPDFRTMAKELESEIGLLDL